MGAFAQVAGSDTLRRAQLSFGLIWAGECAVMVTLGVVAYRDGGAAAVGAVTAARMIPAALVAPFAATLADVSILPRTPFLTAVTGYPASATAGEQVVLDDLGQDARAASPAQPTSVK
jgi:hypothetical protein